MEASSRLAFQRDQGALGLFSQQVKEKEKHVNEIERLNLVRRCLMAPTTLHVQKNASNWFSPCPVSLDLVNGSEAIFALSKAIDCQQF